MKTKSQSEPQKQDKSLMPPKGYKNTLDEQQQKRIKRRELINAEMNKIVKDRF